MTLLMERDNSREGMVFGGGGWKFIELLVNRYFLRMDTLIISYHQYTLQCILIPSQYKTGRAGLQEFDYKNSDTRLDMKT